jgi:hypothetical protein
LDLTQLHLVLRHWEAAAAPKAGALVVEHLLVVLVVLEDQEHQHLQDQALNLLNHNLQEQLITEILADLVLVLVTILLLPVAEVLVVQVHQHQILVQEDLEALEYRHPLHL